MGVGSMILPYFFLPYRPWGILPQRNVESGLLASLVNQKKVIFFFSRFCYSPASTVELVETPVFRRLLVKVFAQKIQSLAKVTVTYKSFRLEEGSKRRGAQQLVLFFSV